MPSYQQDNLLISSGTEKDCVKKLILFKLSDELYAIDICWVQEITKYQLSTTVSNLPPFVKGVLNIKDNPTLVVDLRVLFNMASIFYNDFTLLIVLKIDRHWIGLVTNEVLDILQVKESEINTASELTTLMPRHYIMGVINLPDNILFLLDTERLFENEILTLEESIHDKYISSD